METATARSSAASIAHVLSYTVSKNISTKVFSVAMSNQILLLTIHPRKTQLEYKIVDDESAIRLIETAWACINLDLNSLTDKFQWRTMLKTYQGFLLHTCNLYSIFFSFVNKQIYYLDEMWVNQVRRYGRTKNIKRRRHALIEG